MDLHPDFSDLLAAFVAADVRFALLGGYAVAYPGQGDNPERVARALDDFGAPANVVEAVRVQSESEVVYLGVPPVRIDILRTVDGLETEGAIERAVGAELGELTVPIIQLDDLIANKRAAGRPQDIADVAMLEAVRAGRER